MFSLKINIDSDTIVHTPGGAILHFPAKAIDAGGATYINLIIREAYRMSDIVRAGLVTTANGETLSSGGMVDIEAAVGQTVTITKTIGVSIPTPYIDSKMQLFKGAMDKNGKINWTDPKPLEKSPESLRLDSGYVLYNTNCASCHRLRASLTGPPLQYISGRRGKEWLYSFTRNSQSVISSGDRYANCLYNQYNKTPMPGYPDLAGDDIDLLYHYIDNESKKMRLATPGDHIKHCVDSCEIYNRIKDSISRRRSQLISGNEEVTRINRALPKGNIAPGSSQVSTTAPPVNIQAVYYQFDIQAFGWYNIDIFVHDCEGVKSSTLMVRLKGEYRENLHLFLMIPSSRVFQEGRPLDDKGDQYGFNTENSHIPLPQGVKAFVMAIGENDRSALFGISSFNTMESQSLEITAESVEKGEIFTKMKSFDIQDLEIEVSDTKNSAAIRQTDNQLSNIESIRPKTCDCNCGIVSDSAQ